MSKQQIKTYLVGGAVRDKLLGIPVIENDWVVVGSTPKQMLKEGYTQVGKEFPVFLHPDTKEEYALARTEKKSGKGYTGFICDFEPSVTLEEDLLRRDLTINAIAEEENGELIDPYNGKQDLKNKILRHVSPAFEEDPVRVLRVARFAARLPDFMVAHETHELIQKMVELGEIDHLVAERVWREWQRALTETAPHRFFEILHSCNALSHLFPSLSEHYQSMMHYLVKSAQQSKDVYDRFVCLMFAINNEAQVASLCQQYKIPNDYKDQALLCIRYIKQFKDADVLDAKEKLDLLYELDAFRRDERFMIWLKRCQVCAAVKSNAGIDDYQTPYQAFLDTFTKVKDIKLTDAEMQGIKGKAIADALYEKRLALLV